MTSPNLYEEKEVMEEFISCYRHFTPLWNTNAVEYLCKQKKQPGYQELLKILRRVNPEATLMDVKRKINSLRSCYRRELKKIRCRTYSGYEPRLWWFHSMDFLQPILNLNAMTTTTTHNNNSSSLFYDDSLDEASMQSSAAVELLVANMSHHMRNTHFWQQFFRLYRSMPELWLANSKNYRNRKLKTQSYERLLLHLRHADPNCNIHMLKRKINNLRTSYRRELRKVLESKALGRHGDEYVPSLWYFNELDFLYDEETGEAQTLIAADHELENEYEQHEYDDVDGNEEEFVVSVEQQQQQQAAASTSAGVVEDEDFFADSFQQNEEDMLVIEGDADAETKAEADFEVVKHEAVAEEMIEQRGSESDSDVLKVKNNKMYALCSSSNNNSNTNLQSQRISSAATAQSTSRRRVRNISYDDVDFDGDADYEELSCPERSKRRRHMNHHQMAVNRSVEHADSECDLIGQRMAAHFRNMRPDQRLFAERIISEVLIYGRMNRLSLDARFLPNGNGSGSSSTGDDVNAK